VTVRRTVKASPEGCSGRRSNVSPNVTPTGPSPDCPAGPSWDLRIDHCAFAEFPAETMLITVGATFLMDVRAALGEDADAARFWAAFWNDGFPDRLEATLKAGLGTGSAAWLETARQTARRLLAERFAEVARTAA
jgi:hypothetical protein